MRKVVLANDQFYHIFNRSIEQQPIFTTKREYNRAYLTLDYYRFANPSFSLSRALRLDIKVREEYFRRLRKDSKRLVKIISYCFMPNHFHFLLKQKLEGGISRLLNNFANSYTRYFNTKNKRTGPLFEGVFKAVRIEDDEQLVHISRYIHLNPVVSYIIGEELLDTYPWSSLPEYLTDSSDGICDRKEIIGFFASPKEYRKFIHDQVDYGRRLAAIKHLILE